jgi:uncharacterized protein (TIGR02466 family)
MRVDIFSTPVWRYSIPNFAQHQSEILKAIKKIKRNDPGGRLSNYKGYQSTLSHDYANVKEFQPIFSLVKDVSIPEILRDLDLDVYNKNFVAWVNINSVKNSFNTLHNHNMNGVNLLFSGVCYIKAPPKSGRIEFRNSLQNNLWAGLHYMKRENIYTSQSFSFNPVEGEILIWPSYVWHMVFPNEHKEERISIAFDIYAKSKNS